MGDINIDYTGQKTAEGKMLSANAPLTIALVCALLLVALFVAVLKAEAQNSGANDNVVFGSISGRVTTPDHAQTLAGVRILVRRVHAGIADFYFDRITAADGTFELKYLLPGRYTVEIDARTVPDAMSPVPATVIILDVTPEHGSYADVSIDRSAAVPQNTGAVQRTNKKRS